MKRLILFIALFTFFCPLLAQEKTLDKKNQLWLGYMTSSAISDKYSIWNDFHYVPEGFGVIRTGLTRQFKNASLTGGYAFVWLPAAGGKAKLARHEQRPWAQFQVNSPIGSSWSITQRVRYESRFRENVSDGRVLDSYGFNHRVRFLVTLRKTFRSGQSIKPQPYISLSDEVLLNFGKEIVNTFDQNRISLAFGVQKANTQYQLGLMNRFVQTGNSRYVLNHTLTFWITQKFDLTGLFQKKHVVKDKS